MSITVYIKRCVDQMKAEDRMNNEINEWTEGTHMMLLRMYMYHMLK